MSCLGVQLFILIYLFNRKPKNQRVKRALERKEAKLVENTKNAMFLRGTHTSEVVSTLMKDFVSIMVLSTYYFIL